MSVARDIGRGARTIAGPKKPRKAKRTKPVTGVLTDAERRAAARGTRRAARTPGMPEHRMRKKRAKQDSGKRLERVIAEAEWERATGRDLSAAEHRRRNRRLLRELRKDEPYEGPSARGITESERKYFDFTDPDKANDEGRDYSTFLTRDRKGNLSVRDFEDYAPTGLKIVRALTGDKPGATTPTPGEIGNVAITLGSGGGAGAIRSVARAATAAKSVKARAAAESAKAASKATARHGRKAAKASKTTRAKAPSKVRAKAKGRTRQATQKAKGRYSSPQRKMRRARRTERYTHAATDPVVVPAVSSDPGRAFVEGHLRADPIEAGKTTLEAVPATFAFLGSAAGSTYRAAKTGDTGPLKGVARAGRQALQAVEPLFSGDPEAVERAVEDEVGYVFAPLAPRGAVSAPVRATGRVGKGAFDAARRQARKVAPKSPSPSGGPGRLRHAGQVVAGRKGRKRVARIYAREVEPERRAGVRGAHEVERRARRAKGARSLHNLHGPEAGSAAVVLARYGIGRKGTLERLEDVRRSLDPSTVQYVNAAKTTAWLKANPWVLEDEKLWQAVTELKKQTDELATSPRATHLAQGRVAGVRPPEERVPARAREYTDATTRQDAHQDVGVSRKRIKELRQEAAEMEHRALVLRARVRERTDALGEKARRLDTSKGGSPLNRQLQEILDLEDGARAKLAESKALSRRVKALARELRPLTTGDRPPSIRQRRPQWEAELVREYVDEVRAKRHPDLEDPAWLSERDPGFQPIGGLGGPDIPSIGARATHIKTGRAEVADLAERSLPAALKGSIIGPHIQRGIDRFIRRFNDEFGESRVIDGREARLVTGEQWNRLVDEGKIDPRSHAPLPVRHFKRAVESEGFDLAEFHADLTGWMAGDMRRLDKTPGSKFAIYPREPLREFADQLNPNRSAFEALTSGVGTTATRVVLFSPAWLAAQFVNEGSQAVAAVGVRGMAGAAADLVRLRRNDPEGYQALLHLSGDSAPSAQPAPPRLSMDASDYTSYGDAVRAARKTPVGRFLHDFARLKTFANIDRAKSTHLRTLVTLAYSNKELGTFTKGLSGMLRSQAHISRELKGLSREERASWMARHPKAIQRHLDYTDDVMGNWDAFTRFERQFGPLAAFYPYLRMSFRWMFWTYPKRHPVKAQLLYLLAQQNRDELEKVLGAEPTFLEGAMPVIYGEDGEPDAVFPAGQRFGAPGLNAIVEAIGRENVTGVLRGLNPAIGALTHGVAGLDPFTGEKVAETPAEIGLHTLNQLLSLSPAFRVTGANKLGEGEKSDVAKAFEAIDPNRVVRSALNPFIPLSAERAKMQAILSRALEAVSNDAEYGELVEAILAGDKERLKRLYERVDLADDARDVLDRILPSSPAEDRAVSKAGTILREGSPRRQRKARRTSSASFSGPGWAGGGSPAGGGAVAAGTSRSTERSSGGPEWAR